MKRYLPVVIVFVIFFSEAAKAQVRNDSIKSSTEDSISQFTEVESALHLIDSVKQSEQEKKYQKKINLIAHRSIETSYFSLPIKKIIDYNNFEGIRLGFGLLTNQNFSKYFSIGGYFGYGFKDENWKYGGELTLNVHKKTESKINISYSNDVAERAGYSFLEEMVVSSTEVYRQFLIDKMDLVEEYQVSYSFRSLQYLKTKLFANQAYHKDTDNYFYGPTVFNVTNNFIFNEIGIQFRYAYNEKYHQTLKNKYSPGTNYPILMTNVIFGAQLLDGEYEYIKYEAKITKTFQTKTLGKTKIAFVGGLVDGDIPLTKLYNGHGSYQPFSIESENSFGTMRMGEFYSDRFLSVFFKHDFGNVIIKTNWFKPNFAIVNNVGIGELSENINHQTVKPIQSIEKGYYECGLLVNNILNQSFLAYGFGLFYRYGPYTFTKTADNFSYKLSLTLNM